MSRSAQTPRAAVRAGLLFLDLDRVHGDSKATQFEIRVNCPPKWEDELCASEALRTPIRDWLAELKREYPGHDFAVGPLFDAIDTGRGVDGGLRFALEHAGAADLIEQLGL